MMHFDNIDIENYLIYAIKCYDTPNCIMSEFRDDVKRFNYLKRLFKRYHNTGEIRSRLILNQLIVLYNVFGVPATTRLLFLHVGQENYSALKTFLLFLSYMPDRVEGISNKTIISSDIAVDMNIVEVLRAIK